MSTFRITCTTCQTRLKVRDPSVIGQILACPRCGSMVLVESPEFDSSSAGDSHVLSDSPSASGPSLSKSSSELPASDADPNPSGSSKRLRWRGVPDDLTEGESSSTSNNADPPPHKNRATNKPPVVPGSDASSAGDVHPVVKPGEGEAAQKTVDASSLVVPSTSPPRSPQEDSQPRSSQARPSDHDVTAIPNDRTMAAEQPVLPNDQWMSEKAYRFRQWTLLGGTALAGIVLAIAFFGFLSSRGTGQATVEEHAAREVREKAVQNEQDGSSPAPGNDDQVDDQGPPDVSDAEDAADSDNGDVATGDSEPPKQHADGARDVDGDEQPHPSEQPDREDARSQAGDDSAETPAPQHQAADEESPAGEAPPGFEPRDAEGLVSGNQPSPAAIKQISPLFAPRVHFPEPAAIIEDLTEVADPAKEESAQVESEAEAKIIVARPPKVNVAARLADPIPGIRFDDTPLVDFLRFITDFSTVPITVEWETLAAKEMGPETPVSVRRRDTNVAGALAGALRPLNLNFETYQGQLIISAVPDDSTEETRHFDVGDLLDDDPDSADQLAEIVSSLIDPTSWSVNGGEQPLRQQQQQLIAQHEPRVLDRIELFLKRLRDARTADAQQRSVLPRPMRSRESLSTQLTVNFGRPTRLPVILRYLEEATETRILVDWRALIEMGWAPQSETTLRAANQSLEAILDNLLSENGLGFRVWDEDVLLITSQGVLEREPTIEIFPMASLAPQELERLEREIQSVMGESHFWDGGGDGLLLFDPASRCLLVRLPAAKQRRLADYLRQHERLAQPRRANPVPLSTG